MRNATGAAIPGLVLLLAAALAAAADLPAGTDAAVAEGKRWFQEAGNTELSGADRNAARVKAWKALWPVKEALDLHEEAHPADADALDRKYGEVRMMVHWLKKESPIGLLEGTGVGPAKGTAPRLPAPGAPPTPAPPAPGSPPRPASPAPPPAPPAPPPAAAATPESLLAEAEDYERRHPHDVPGMQERYLLVSGADPSLANPVVRKALDRVGELEGRLKDAYRVLRDGDPDALEGMTDVRIKGMVTVVARDLASRDPAVRERAAKTLGLLSHAEGIHALKKALDKEEEGACVEASLQALVLIGGKKGADAIGDFVGHERHSGAALGAMIRMTARNPVDRRIAAKEMSRWMSARDEGLWERMMTALRGLGVDGLHGLAACCDRNTTPARLVAVIKELSRTKEPAVARVLARYFRPGGAPGDEAIRAAALDAVRTMAKKENLGEAVIPHLFVGLRHRETRYQTTLLLQELTGKDFTVKNWGSWSAWWKSTHPGWTEDGEGK